MNVESHDSQRPFPQSLPSQRTRGGIESIQILRGVAALLVVQYHISTMLIGFGPDLFLRFAHVGQAGVDIFFVISGFIMSYVASSTPQTPTGFVTNRIVRIVPLYWFATSLYIAGALLGLKPFGLVPMDAEYLIKSYLFLPMTKPGTESMTPVILQGWTLNYEIFFYVAFGVALLMRPERPHTTVIALLVAILLGMHLLPQSGVISFYGNSIMLEFAFGIVLARLHGAGLRVPGWIAVGLVAAGSGLLIMSSADPESYRVFKWGMPSVLIVAGALWFPRLEGNPFKRLLVHIGDASYSIYLMHFLVVQSVPKFILVAGLPLDSVAMPYVFILAGTLGSIALGMLTYHLIEKPSIRYLRNFGKRRALSKRAA